MISGLIPPSRPPPQPKPPPPPKPPLRRSSRAADLRVVADQRRRRRWCRSRSCRPARDGPRPAARRCRGSTPCGVRAVGEHDDRVSRVSRAGCGGHLLPPVGGTDGSISAIASIEARIAWPIAVPREVVSLFDRVQQLAGVGGRRHEQAGAAGERDQADPRAVRLRLDERCVAAFSAAVIRLGVDVGRAHRPGDVDRQQDRRRARRHRLRSVCGRRRPDSEHAQAQQKQGRRDAAPPQRAAGQSAAHEHSRRDPHGRPAPAPPRPPRNRAARRGRPAARTGPTASSNVIRRSVRAQDGEDRARGQQQQRRTRRTRPASGSCFVVRGQPQVDGATRCRRAAAASDAGWYEPPVVLAMSVSVSSSRAVWMR